MTEPADRWRSLLESIEAVRRCVYTVSVSVARDVEFCTDPDRRTDLRLSASSALELEGRPIAASATGKNNCR